MEHTEAAAEMLLGRLIVKRTAIDLAIDETKLLIGDISGRREPPAPVASQPRPAKVAAAPRKSRRSPDSVRSENAAIEERDHSIMKALREAGGLASSRTLRRSITFDASMSESQQGAAFRNTVQRLKKKGLIDRTGNTWSLVTS